MRVKLVEPGHGPTTRFTANGASRMEGLFPDAYAAFAQPILAAFAQVTAVTTESDVAEAVYRAANDVSGNFVFPPVPTPWPWLSRHDWRRTGDFISDHSVFRRCDMSRLNPEERLFIDGALVSAEGWTDLQRNEPRD